MDDAMVQLFQKLVRVGAVPGKDFSCDPEQQALHISEHCLTLLEDAHPEVDWRAFMTPFLDDQSSLIDAIHKQLGCRFVEILIQRMIVRCQGLGDAQASWYLNQILIGVEDRTGLRLLPLLDPLLLPEERLRFEWLLRQEDGMPCQDWLYDLVLAAGGTYQDVMLVDQEIWLSEAGLALLEAVWIGQYEMNAEVSPLL